MPPISPPQCTSRIATFQTYSGKKRNNRSSSWRWNKLWRVSHSKRQRNAPISSIHHKYHCIRLVCTTYIVDSPTRAHNPSLVRGSRTRVDYRGWHLPSHGWFVGSVEIGTYQSRTGSSSNHPRHSWYPWPNNSNHEENDCASKTMESYIDGERTKNVQSKGAHVVCWNMLILCETLSYRTYHGPRYWHLGWWQVWQQRFIFWPQVVFWCGSWPSRGRNKAFCSSSSLLLSSR